MLQEAERIAAVKQKEVEEAALSSKPDENKKNSKTEGRSVKKYKRKRKNVI